MIGVDEAGKGPVLGPMVAAAVRAASENLPSGIDDSKRLAPDRRRELAARLRNAEGVETGVATVEVERIDDPATDMNGLVVAAQADAIRAVAHDGDDAIADAGDVSEDRFARRVREAVAGTAPIDVTAEHAADERHALVGAASVLAKVERDRRVAALAERYGEVGSGYPSDPTTRDFLREYVRDHDTLPDCARASWSTCEDVLAAAEQSRLAEF